MDISEMHEKASNLLSDNKTDEALDLYNKILEENPSDEVALSSLMDIYQDTDKVKYYIARANYNIVNGKIEYGINDCKKALNIDASNIEAREKLARLYRVSNKPLKAIDEFTRVIELDKRSFQSYIELIDLYTKENALESAINIAIKANEEFKDDANFNDLLAKLYFDGGNYDKALEVVSDALLKAKILLQADKNDEAKAILDSYKTDNAEKEQLALYNLLSAQYCYNTKDYAKAFEFIDKYSSLVGPHPLSFQMRALCYEEMNDDFMAAYNWGFMNKALKKFDEALVEFNHAYNINPKNKDILIELAKLYELNKEKYTAIDFWQKVYEIDGDETAKGILCEFYQKEGDYSMAEKFGYKPKEVEQKSYESENMVEDEGLLNKIINLFSKK